MEARFQIGDVCRIREWDDMEREFGLTGTGSINCPVLRFIRDMRYLCGKTFIIDKILRYGDGTSYYSSTENIEGTYYITDYMLEYVEYSDERNPEYLETDLIGVLSVL